MRAIYVYWKDRQTGKEYNQRCVPPVSIGRDFSNDIILSHQDVSRRHATLYLQDDSLFLEDLRSSNGTQLDERDCREPVKVLSEQSISIAIFELQISFTEPLEEPEATEQPSENLFQAQEQALFQGQHEEIETRYPGKNREEHSKEIRATPKNEQDPQYVFEISPKEQDASAFETRPPVRKK